MRTKAARDHNEPAIVAALRAAGYHVSLLSDGGVPDLLVIRPAARNADRIKVCTTPQEALDHARMSMISLIEVKQKNGKLTPDQVKWFDAVLDQQTPL